MLSIRLLKRFKPQGKFNNGEISLVGTAYVID